MVNHQRNFSTVSGPGLVGLPWRNICSHFLCRHEILMVPSLSWLPLFSLPLIFPHYPNFLIYFLLSSSAFCMSHSYMSLKPVAFKLGYISESPEVHLWILRSQPHPRAAAWEPQRKPRIGPSTFQSRWLCFVPKGFLEKYGATNK